MSIKNLGCEGYGFKVLNCVEFKLMPEQEKEILISYTPDLGFSYFTRELFIYTNEGVFRFDMEVQLPARRFRDNLAEFYQGRSENLTILFSLISCALATSFIFVYIKPLISLQKSGNKQNSLLINVSNLWHEANLIPDALALQERNQLLQEELNSVGFKGRKRVVKGRVQDFKEEAEPPNQPKYKNNSWADWAEDHSGQTQSQAKVEPPSEVSAEKVMFRLDCIFVNKTKLVKESQLPEVKQHQSSQKGKKSRATTHASNKQQKSAKQPEEHLTPVDTVEVADQNKEDVTPKDIHEASEPEKQPETLQPSQVYFFSFKTNLFKFALFASDHF